MQNQGVIPDQWRGFKAYARNIPRTNRGTSRMRKCRRALIEREQAAGLKKWCIAATNHTAGGGGSLSDWDEPGKRLENDIPACSGKSYKTRLCIRRQNIVDRYWNYRKNPSWKFLPMYQVLILRSIKKEMKRYKHYTYIFLISLEILKKLIPSTDIKDFLQKRVYIYLNIDKYLNLYASETQSFRKKCNRNEWTYTYIFHSNSLVTCSKLCNHIYTPILKRESANRKEEGGKKKRRKKKRIENRFGSQRWHRLLLIRGIDEQTTR